MSRGCLPTGQCLSIGCLPNGVCLGGSLPGGVCLRVYTPHPLEMASAAVGTHPTGMHTCATEFSIVSMFVPQITIVSHIFIRKVQVIYNSQYFKQ